ncbi:MAG: GTPase Era [Oscillochloridaceae bacterium]|nr:GTPase Era [Chloroflexaceae bacterium]MDW8389943.1 GTPase Era [Oscillochloridaceae bacterium]
MLQFSYDPEAGSLYVYFTELEEGQAVGVLEYPAALLLDAQERIIGLRLDLDDEIALGQLELALDGEYERLDTNTGQLTLRVVEEEPARVLPLPETAILDLDGDETVLGVELTLPAELRTPAALERLAPLMLPLEEAPAGGEGPVVFTLPPSQVPATETVAVAPPEAAAGEAPPPVTRSGFVALVGKPNVGKSTLLNALLGQKVAIVSPRPQTTRVPVRGILTRPGAQIIFVDTPGIHQPSHALGRLMVNLAERTLPNADVIGFMVDISQPPSQLDRRIARQVQRARGRKLLILNKVDLKPRGQRTYLEDYRSLGPWEQEIAISALKGLGLAALLEEIVARLPEGPLLYPPDQLTDQSEQHLAAEFVREKVLYYTQQEVPHAVAIEVEEWEPREGVTYIRMTINVEREGQKRIIIGAGGAMLKKIGSAARQEIERLIGGPVYLDLWVKVRPHWRDDVAALGWLGYRARDWR